MQDTSYELIVNGVARLVEGTHPHESLLYVMRERLGLPGAENACEQGECGSCSLLLDGEPACACLELGAAAAGREVVTIEGLGEGLGDSPIRPDGPAKVQGRFASDLRAEGMLWGRTLRSPHAHARIRALDVSRALAVPGVVCVVTAADIPGSPTYGPITADQPVLATDVVRYQGEPVAAVAADHPDTAARALDAIAVDYEPLPLLVDPDAALCDEGPAIHPEGNVVRQVRIRHGDPDAPADVVVEGTYEVGMQDQAFLGPEARVAAVPDGEGGVDLWVAAQWSHHDRDQVAACLGLPPEAVRLHRGGGGAFGTREGIGVQVHACLLALRSGRPVKMSHQRDESLVGHVHRHPARLRYRHHATTEGDLVKVEAEILLDGGAYASSSPAVVANAARFAAGPYRVPHAVIDAAVVRTNHPPCGAMRGFGEVQVCFAHESQMDRLATTLGLDPVELRLRNALRTGDVLPGGQVVTGPAPVAECIRAAVAHPLPPERTPGDPGDPGDPEAVSGTVDEDRWLELPGGVGRTADPRRVRRGVGIAVGFEDLTCSEGFDDTAEARVRLESGVATVSSAVAEVGPGFVTIATRIARTVLGCVDVVIEKVDAVTVGSAGSSSASRQTWMSGGAVLRASQVVAGQVRDKLADRVGLPLDELSLTDDGRIVSSDGLVDVTVAAAAGDEVVEASAVHQHRPTTPLDDQGQGDADVGYVFAAHRAVVDVDVDLGLVRVVQVTTGQDHLIPTVADAPEVLATGIEQPEPGAPPGAKGGGEPPTTSSTPAVVAAIRAASGVELTRVPVRPWDLV